MTDKTTPGSAATITDQHRPLTVYTFHCGRCGKALEGEFGPAWYGGEASIEDYDDLDARDWQNVADKWVCPDCRHWCEKADDDSEQGLGPQEGCCNGI